jgi:lactoylglutathione lyase
MKYKIGGLAHIGIFVSNMDRSKEFYTKTLGFNTIFEYRNEDWHAVFVKKDGLILELLKLLKERTKRNDGIIGHFAFEVENIEEAAGELRKKGVEFETGGITDAPDYWEKGAKWIHFRGPDGEHLELNEIL